MVGYVYMTCFYAEWAALSAIKTFSEAEQRGNGSTHDFANDKVRRGCSRRYRFQARLSTFETR